jgi:hypothetical protein
MCLGFQGQLDHYIVWYRIVYYRMVSNGIVSKIVYYRMVSLGLFGTYKYNCKRGRAGPRPYIYNLKRNPNKTSPRQISARAPLINIYADSTDLFQDCMVRSSYLINSCCRANVGCFQVLAKNAALNQ